MLINEFAHSKSFGCTESNVCVSPSFEKSAFLSMQLLFFKISTAALFQIVHKIPSKKEAIVSFVFINCTAFSPSPINSCNVKQKVLRNRGRIGFVISIDRGFVADGAKVRSLCVRWESIVAETVSGEANGRTEEA